MRSKFLVCAAIAAAGSCVWFGPVAYAAPAKRGSEKRAADAKDKDKKANELHADDKSMKKQLQWEDKVMGPDSTRAELDKIARAHAITEKAEKDKEKQAAIEAAAPAPRPEKAKKAEVALPSMADEKSSDKPSDQGRSHEISPKLATEAAHAPVPAAKPADDKFIDKLLREEDAPSKKHASAEAGKNDKELENLLAGAKETPAGGRKRRDSVDDLLKTADKGPAMPAPRAQSGLPEWAKQPDIAPTAAPPPPPPPVAARPLAPKNDGVIHVVQGAAIASASPPARTSLPARGSRRGARSTTSTTPVAWSDPFAEKKSSSTYAAEAPKKETASRPSATSSGSSWNDPFADGAETRKTTPRRAAPVVSPAPTPASAPRRNDKANDSSHPAGWKDPFTKAPSAPTRTPIAMRELGKNESSKWEIASHHAAAPHASSSDAHAAGGWSVLQKRAR